MKDSELFELLADFLKDLDGGIKVAESQRRYRMQLLYQFESNLEKIKEQYQLFKIDNSIESNSVIESFISNCKKDSNGNIVCDEPSYLKTTDYQYWILAFLLLNYPEIRGRELKLYEIIKLFIDRYKDKSFTYKDIEMTKSGRTRCDTNIRFAFTDLNHLGLVNQFRVSKNARWALTYLGFILALSIILDADERRGSIFSRQVTSLNMDRYNRKYVNLEKEFPWRVTLSSGYNPIDPFILYRLSKLRDPDYFANILNQAQLKSLDLPVLKKGSQIFSKYYSIIFDELDKEVGKEKFFNTIYKRFKIEFDEEEELSKFMEQLSLEINSEEFINNLIRTVGGVSRSDS